MTKPITNRRYFVRQNIKPIHGLCPRPPSSSSPLPAWARPKGQLKWRQPRFAGRQPLSAYLFSCRSPGSDVNVPLFHLPTPQSTSRCNPLSKSAVKFRRWSLFYHPPPLQFSPVTKKNTFCRTCCCCWLPRCFTSLATTVRMKIWQICFWNGQLSAVSARAAREDGPQLIWRLWTRGWWMMGFWQFNLEFFLLFFILI